MNLFKTLVLSKKSPTEKLLDEITDYDIYCELIGHDVEVGGAIESPLRDNDHKSFSLFIPTTIEDAREDEIWWTDFSLGGSGNVFSFVQEFADFKYGIDLVTRMDVIKFLDTELDLGIYTESSGGSIIKRDLDFEAAKIRKDIQFTSRKLTRRDKFWWCEIAVDKELLEEHDVRSLKYLLDDDYTIKYKFRQSELGFAFVVYDKVKIYCPEAGEFKWRNTCPADYIMGAAQCSRDDVLVITKSMKDILCFKSLMFCDVIAAQSEKFKYPPELIAKIKARYSKVYIVMDYDETGIAAAARLEAEGFEVVWVSKDVIESDNTRIVLDKDFSDYLRNHGVREGIGHLKMLFPNLPNEQFREDRIEYFEKMKSNIINL